MLYKDSSLDDLRDPLFWQSVCPFLTCSETRWPVAGDPEVDSSHIRRGLLGPASRAMQTRGFFAIDSTQFEMDLRREHLIALLARGVMELMRCGFPPLYILMFDEAWVLTSVLSAFIPGACSIEGEGDLEAAPLACHVGDFYVFAVLSAKQQLSLGNDAYVSVYRPGPPHRDRPTAGPSSFSGASLMPQYCSIWLALTPATTSNSCLYCVPIACDEGYYLKGDAAATVEAPLRIEACVAQPLQQGSMLCFSHRLLHWGSAMQPQGTMLLEEDGSSDYVAAPPRIAFTTAFAQTKFEAAYFDHDKYPIDGTTPLALRLALVAGQSVQYEHLAPLDKHSLALTRRIFHAQKGMVSDTYYEKISSACQMLSFVKRNQRAAK